MNHRHHQAATVRQAPYFVGIDIGKKTHYAYILDTEGQACVARATAFANSAEGFAALRALIAQATAQAAPAQVTIGCEATGPYWLSLYEHLIGLDYQPVVLNPFYVKARRGTTLRGTKTDTVDARLIAEILRRDTLPLSHVPDAAVQGLRDLTRLRAYLVGQCSDVKRRVVGVLDRSFPEFGECFRDVCGQTARAVLEEWTLPEQIAAVSTARLSRLIERVSRGRPGAEQARALRQAARHSIGVHRGADALAFELRLLLHQVTYLEGQVELLDQEIAQRYRALDTHLVSIPGVGVATAPAIFAEIGDIRRFTHSDQVVALVGVDPQLHQSGQSAGQAKMSKRGSPYLRRAIWHAALSAARCDPMFHAIYERQRERGKHHLVALSHVANKLARVVYSVLKGQRPYDPQYPGAASAT